MPRERREEVKILQYLPLLPWYWSEFQFLTKILFVSQYL